MVNDDGTLILAPRRHSGSATLQYRLPETAELLILPLEEDNCGVRPSGYGSNQFFRCISALPTAVLETIRRTNRLFAKSRLGHVRADRSNPLRSVVPMLHLLKLVRTWPGNRKKKCRFFQRLDLVFDRRAQRRQIVCLEGMRLSLSRKA